MYSQGHHTIGLSMALGKSALCSVPVSGSYLFIYLFICVFMYLFDITHTFV